ncbi:MAG: FkbM family methyltransferase [Actinomycetota bacterium]
MTIRQLGKRTLRRAGLNVSKLINVPFGVDAFDDVAGLAGEVSVVFDIGANIGQTVVRVRRALPHVQIYSFEPVPSTYAKLVANVGSMRGVDCVQSAVGDAEGEIEITESLISGHNTIHLSAKPESPTITVPLTTVDAFATERGVDIVDLLKIDTEGYETAVLQGAKGLLETGRVRFVLAECDFTHRPEEPHGAFFDIADTLLPLGFRVVATYVGGVDGDGWRWGDALFMMPSGPRAVTCSPHAVPR